ncbi:hypothetical protein Hanom_Chr16g01455681 [Helianthus anomalus]
MSLNNTMQNPENDYTEDPEDDAATAADVANIDGMNFFTYLFTFFFCIRIIVYTKKSICS